MTIIKTALNALKTLFLGIVSVCLPHTAKRALFMTIMYVGLAREGMLQDATLEKLNEGFKLVQNLDALDLPAHALSDSVLETIDFRTIMENYRAQGIEDRAAIAWVSQAAAERSPWWIHYDLDDMARDMYNLVLDCLDKQRMVGQA